MDNPPTGVTGGPVNEKKRSLKQHNISLLVEERKHSNVRRVYGVKKATTLAITSSTALLKQNKDPEAFF